MSIHYPSSTDFIIPCILLLLPQVKSAVDADMLRLYKLAFSCVKFESVVNVHGNVHPLNLAGSDQPLLLATSSSTEPNDTP